MQRGLFDGEIDADGFRFAGCEIADVAPSGAVDERREGVKCFQLANHRQANFRGVVVIEQRINDLLGTRIVLQNSASPGCNQCIIEAVEYLFFPILPGGAGGCDSRIQDGLGSAIASKSLRQVITSGRSRCSKL